MIDEGEHGSQEIRQIVQLVARYNSKWDGTTRPVRLTLLLTVDDGQDNLPGGPPIRDAPLKG
jgi:hypothetical protein